MSQKELFLAINKKDLDKVKELIKTKMNLNYKLYDLNPLTAASITSSLSIVKELLEAGANPNITLKDGYTALMHASMHNNFEIVEELLKHGANPNLQNNEKLTSLMLAVENSHYNNVKILLNHDANPNLQNNDKWTALFIAAEFGYSKIAKVLLMSGANPNVCNKDGDTALFCAAKSGHIQIVKILLSYGANPNPLKKKPKHYPVLAAAQAGYKDVVKCLLEAGAYVDIKTKSGEYLLDLCEKLNIQLKFKKPVENLIAKHSKKIKEDKKVEEIKDDVKTVEQEVHHIQEKKKMYNKKEIIGAKTITVMGKYDEDFKVNLLDDKNNIHLQIDAHSVRKHLIMTSYENDKKGVDEILTGRDFPLLVGGPLKIIIDITPHFFNIKFNTKQIYKFKARLNVADLRYISSTSVFEILKS